jgi:hypothetical protein
MGPDQGFDPTFFYVYIGIALFLFVGLPVIAMLIGVTAPQKQTEQAEQTRWTAKEKIATAAMLIIVTLGTLIITVVVRKRQEAPPVHKELNRDVEPR